MSLTLGALRELVGFGLTAEQILAVAEAQGAAPKRSSGAERQARYRARNNDVTSNVTSDASLSDVTPLSEGSEGSPKPLPTPPNLSEEPPIVPQKPARKAKAEPPKGAFAAFWAEYPLKVGKLAAEKAYPRAWARQLEENPEIAPEAEILAGLGRCKAAWDPDFIPNPLTFLNQGRWMDVPEPDLPDSATGPPKFDLAAFEARRAERDREQAA